VANTSASDTHGAERARAAAPRSARPGTFTAQVMAELRKVVRPTRRELTTYTIVVLVFVAVIMAYVFGLDLLFQRLVAFVFAG